MQREQNAERIPPLPGKASPDVTAQFVSEQAWGNHSAYRPGQWKTSPLGFGCYRVLEQAEEHREALRQALQRGVNLIDTSTNYTDGSSERLVGQVLRELVETGDLQREQVVVVSKVGYIQGGNMRYVNERAKSDKPFTEITEYAENCWHCIHPDFLADQLAQSLARLNLETLDVLLLHNPEYFLMDAWNRGADPEKTYQEYYRRIGAAFEYLESQVEAGTIQQYGISSNTFIKPEDDAEHTSLGRCWQLAEDAGKKLHGNADQHHFRVVQMPLNLLERGAVEIQHEAAAGKSCLEFAAEKNLLILANRPLNAMGANRLIRLAAPREEGERLQPTERQALLQRLDSAGEVLRRHIPTDSPTGQQAHRLLTHAEFLRANMKTILHHQHWVMVCEQQLLPMAHWGLSAAMQATGTNTDPEKGIILDDPKRAKLMPVFEEYQTTLMETLKALDAHFLDISHRESNAMLRHVADELNNTNNSDKYYSQLLEGGLAKLSIGSLLNLKSQPVILVGMRHPDYVSELCDWIDTSETWGDSPAPDNVANKAKQIGEAIETFLKKNAGDAPSND
jgi:aryl-alcohol dehydrogenase-like predicted oxidoreductase